VSDEVITLGAVRSRPKPAVSGVLRGQFWTCLKRVDRQMDGDIE